MLSDLAFALVQRGYRVSVITSGQRYDEPNAVLASRETVGGVAVYRVSTTRFGRSSILGRMIDYLTFYASAARTLWQLAERGDVVVAKTDPPMLSVIAAPIARARRAHLINWLQDLFPEVAQQSHVGHGHFMQLIYRALASLRSHSLRSSALNVVIGQRMATNVRALGVNAERISIIHNWADGDAIKPVHHGTNHLRSKWDLHGKFVVGYSGNLGRAHDYRTFLEAIRLTEAAMRPETDLKSASNPDKPTRVPDIRWLFLGGGANRKRLQNEASQFGLQTVQFRNYEPRENLSESLSAADLHLATLNPNLEGLIVPSKIYSIGAAGRPTIFVGDEDGEVARMLKQDGSGYTVAPGDGAGLAAYVLELARNSTRNEAMGKNARRAFERAYDVKRAIAEWSEAIDRIAQCKPLAEPDAIAQSSQSRN